MTRFRLDAPTRDAIASVARGEVRRLRTPLTLAQAQRAVSEWAQERRERVGRGTPSPDQLSRAAVLAANEAADYAKRCARAGRWL